jgi:hypothetical protein
MITWWKFNMSIFVFKITYHTKNCYISWHMDLGKIYEFLLNLHLLEWIRPMRYTRLRRVNLKNVEYKYLSTLHFAKNLPTDFTLIYCIFTHFFVAGHRKQYARSKRIQEKCRRNSRLFVLNLRENNFVIYQMWTLGTRIFFSEDQQKGSLEQCCCLHVGNSLYKSLWLCHYFSSLSHLIIMCFS